MSGIQKLIRGYRSFYDKYFRSANSVYSALRNGQNPGVMIIACSDSRVDPALLTDSAPGDIFVVRNIANLIPGAEAADQQYSVTAAIEYAVNILRVGHIVVMGHSQCGGIKALLSSAQGETIPDSIARWVSCAGQVGSRILSDYTDETAERQAELCEQASILASLDNLRALPFLERALSSGALKTHGWYFDIQTGQISAYDAAEDKFSALT